MKTGSRGSTLPQTQATGFRPGTDGKVKSMSIDKNRVKGAAKQAAGATKEAIGKAVGNKEMEIKGKIQHAEGEIQSAAGKANDKLKDMLDN